jgi:hypothetical protein
MYYERWGIYMKHLFGNKVKNSKEDVNGYVGDCIFNSCLLGCGSSCDLGCNSWCADCCGYCLGTCSTTSKA